MAKYDFVLLNYSLKVKRDKSIQTKETWKVDKT